jgi:signal transduction histidine kinase
MSSRPDPSLPESILTACGHMVDGIIVIDQERAIRYMNGAARQMLGAPEAPEDRVVLCKSALRCGTLGDLNRYCDYCEVQTALRTGQGSSRYVTAVGAPGSRVPVDVACTAVPGPEPLAVLVVRPRIGPGDQAELSDYEQTTAAMSPHTKAVLQGLVRSARELLVADYAALGRLDEYRLEVAWLVQEGSRSAATATATTPVGRGIRGRVISTGQPISISDFPVNAPDPPHEHPTMQSEGLRAALAVPILIHGQVNGVLMVACRHPAEYGPGETQVLRNLAALAGEVLDHADWVVSAQAASIRTEREWLAAELHDGLAQLLGAITQRLKVARWVLGRSTEPATLAADLQEVLELSEQAHQELRLALGELRTPAAQGDFRVALESTLNAFSERSGLIAELVEVPEHRPPLPAPVTLQVLRIIQEALNNARKHSGGTHVWVRWTFDGAVHTFSIKDDGCGLAPGEVGHGFGLTIMSDRARRAGGELHLYGAPDSGCTVLLTIPDQSGGGWANDSHPGPAGG